MTQIGGTYACVITTPLGEQRGLLEIVPDDAGGFSGVISGDLGRMEIAGGTVSGQTLRWKMVLTMFMNIELDCAATIDGDTITGEATTLMFGTMALKGRRAG